MNCTAQEQETLRNDLLTLTRPEMESVMHIVHVLAEDHRNSEEQLCERLSS